MYKHIILKFKKNIDLEKLLWDNYNMKKLRRKIMKKPKKVLGSLIVIIIITALILPSAVNILNIVNVNYR